MTENVGYFQKFYVSRVDGRDQPGGDRENAQYFTLDLIHDPLALPALEAYCKACEESHPALAKDLRERFLS